MTTSSQSSASSETSHRRKSFLQNFTTALDDVYKEIEIMKQMDHPHIVKLFEIIDAPTSDKLYLIMPVADYGESIEYDPLFNPYSFIKGGSSASEKTYKQQDSLDFDFCEPSTASRQADQVAQQQLVQSEGKRHLLFHPNHRL